MKKTSLIICLIAVSASLLLNTGCLGRAIKEGVGVARGAQGLYAPIEPISTNKEARPLGPYSYFELENFTDSFGQVPPEVMTAARITFPQLLAEKKLPDDPTGKTLLIRGQFIHYEDASTLGIALGPLEEVIARVELVDKSSGNIIGVANCIGRTTEAVNLGAEKKGQGLAKAIVSWLDKSYPKEGREEVK